MRVPALTSLHAESPAKAKITFTRKSNQQLFVTCTNPFSLLALMQAGAKCAIDSSSMMASSLVSVLERASVLSLGE